MIILLLILILTSCSISEVVIEPPQTKSIDTTYTPRVKADTIKKIPIRFDVHITNWEDGNV